MNQPKKLKKAKIIIEISSRHVHPAQKDLEILFGRGYKLTPLRPLFQDGHFAAHELVTLKTLKGEFKKVRVLGPCRKKTQVEISQTDAINLGLNAPFGVPGDLEIMGSPGLTIIGPEGRVELKEGVIIPHRHIHASTKDAAKYKIKDGQLVSVEVEGKRGLVFHHVIVRVYPTFVWRLHLDTDEGNAAGLKGGEEGEVWLP